MMFQVPDFTKLTLEVNLVDEKLPNNRTFNVCTDWPYWIEHDIEPEKLAHMLDTWYVSVDIFDKQVH
jgi:hypothetical protein